MVLRTSWLIMPSLSRKVCMSGAVPLSVESLTSARTTPNAGCPSWGKYSRICRHRERCARLLEALPFQAC